MDESAIKRFQVACSGGQPKVVYILDNLMNSIWISEGNRVRQLSEAISLKLLALAVGPHDGRLYTLSTSGILVCIDGKFELFSSLSAVERFPVLAIDFYGAIYTITQQEVIKTSDKKHSCILRHNFPRPTTMSVDSSCRLVLAYAAPNCPSIEYACGLCHYDQLNAFSQLVIANGSVQGFRDTCSLSQIVIPHERVDVQVDLSRAKLIATDRQVRINGRDLHFQSSFLDLSCPNLLRVRLGAHPIDHDSIAIFHEYLLNDKLDLPKMKPMQLMGLSARSQ
jgi:hypothetical protein